VEKRNELIRVLKVVSGFALLPIGTVMIVLPGPGLLVLACGLMLLEGEFRWAAKVRENLTEVVRRGMSWLHKVPR
jgi:Putative transmembrane protein (PGPGW)